MAYGFFPNKVFYSLEKNPIQVLCFSIYVTMLRMKYDVVIIGAGAGGFFSAITAKQAFTYAKVAILEKSLAVLSKVKISGGGRCNVTNGCLDPKLLVKNYPRGEKELLGPFTRFGPKDTIAWFNSKNISLSQEKDGRIFPKTNSSQTIIDCLTSTAKDLGVDLLLKQRLLSVEKTPQGFTIFLESQETIHASKLILATGSSPDGYKIAKALGHTIIEPVPSLFTFNVPSSYLKDLSGIVISDAEVSLEGTKFVESGPVLITHFGFSGPCVLKLSAFAARYLASKNYQANLKVNWLKNETFETVLQTLMMLKKQNPAKLLLNLNPFEFPKQFWKTLLGDFAERRLNDLSTGDLQKIAKSCTNDIFQIEGKTTHKEEFVTSGGVCLKEVDFKKLESKVCPGLFFAGEVLDIDAVTGGFNFQNAWTTGFIAGCSCLL